MRPINRRSFLRVSVAVGGGMLVSLYVDRSLYAQKRRRQTSSKVYPPDAFVHIRPDGQIVITVNRVELGQGVTTSLPMILADEMDADWSQVVAELAPAADVYRDPVYGLQMTGGSSSIANSFQQYRELGAKTRAMLVAVAAARWGVALGQCRTSDSVVHGPAEQSARYAELADDAARQPVPDNVRLKNPADFRLIGKPVRRLDSRAKCDGSQKFGIDLELPGMQVAVSARPPVFGGRVRSFDGTEARRIAGVRDVFEIPLVHGTAVAVVADRFWTAKRARDRLQIDWDLSGIEHPDSARLFSSYKALARTVGKIFVNRGDDTALDRIPSSRRILAEFEFPYLAHTPMEPLNTTIRFDGDHAEAWVPSQSATWEHSGIAEVVGLKPQQVTYYTTFAGGGFGRRTPMDAHVQREAAEIAKRVSGTPVKLVWTREDDVRGGYYRPMCVHRVEVGIGRDDLPAAWQHVIVCQSFVMGTGNPFEAVLVKNGVDYLVVEGSGDTRYAIPNFRVSTHHPTVNVPIYSWRSVGHTHNCFVMETLIDELATRAKVDPIAYRLALLSPDAKKLRAALTLLREKSGAWRHNLPPNHAAGVACTEYHDTASACVVDVSIENGRPRLHRVTVALDCGRAVNPLTVEAQYQGGVTFGVTQLMAKGAITLTDGRVDQRRFDGYTPPYIGDAPAAIDVHIVPSDGAPTGVGECPVPMISPAVANALAKLTRKRYRTLPLVTI